MDLDEARRLLQIGPDTSEPERRAAFERQRQQFDERIAAAATPRLAETFRLAQARLVEAYEAIELAQAAAESPALRAVTDQALAPVAPAAAPVPPAGATVPPPPTAPVPSPIASTPARPRRLTAVVLGLVALAAAGGGYIWNEHARRARLDGLRDRLQRIDARLADLAREVPEPAPSADGRVDALREQWRQQRAALRTAALDTARKRVDAHPAHAAAENARAALAAEREDATAASLDAAEHALPPDPEIERAFLADYAQPLLAWCFDHAAGEDGPVRWARAEEPRAVADVVAALRARLAVLDHAAPPAPESAGEVAHLAALTGADDADAKRWKARLGEIARLRAFLVAQMPAAADAKGAAHDALGGAVVRLQALIGSDDAQARDWRAALSDAADAEQRLRTGLAKLDAPDSAPAADDLAALDALEQVAGADDPEVKRLRAALPDRLLAAAMRETDVAKQGAALVDAAKLGSWKALARIVALRQWNRFALVDPTRFDPAHAPTLAGGVTASQLAGEALANWACRHKELGERWTSEMVRARGLMMADALTDPVVMEEAAWLWDDYEPKDAAQATKLRGQALDETRRRLQAAPVVDRPAWKALLGLAREAAEDLKDLPGQVDFLQRLIAADGGDAELRAALHHERGLCLQAGANPKGSITDAEGEFAAAADAYRSMAKPPASDLSASLSSRAACAEDGGNAHQSFARAIALYKEAAGIATAGELPASQAYALQEAAGCEEPALNVQGSWRTAAEDYGRAADAWGAAGTTWRLVQARFDQGRCLMGASPPATVEARAVFIAAQRAAEGGKDEYRTGLALYRQALTWLPSGGAADASWSRADECFAAAAKRFTEPSARVDLGHMHFQRGTCARPDLNPAGSWKTAADFYGESAEISEQLGNAADLGESLYDQAYCRSTDHDPAGSNAEAVALYARAATAYEKAGRIADQALATHQQAWYMQPDHLPAGSWSQAAALYERAAALRTTDGKPPPHVSITLNNQGYCVRPDTNKDGTWPHAKELYQQALERAGDDHDAEQQGVALSGLEVCARPDKNPAGSWSEAKSLVERAVASLRQADQSSADVKKELAGALHDLGWCSDPHNDSAGSYDAADAAYAESARLRVAAGDAKSAAISLHNQASCNSPGEASGGSWDRAASLYADAAAKAAAGQDKKQQGQDLVNQALCLYNGNNGLNDHIRQVAQLGIGLAREAGDAATVERGEKLLKE